MKLKKKTIITQQQYVIYIAPFQLSPIALYSEQCKNTVRHNIEECFCAVVAMQEKQISAKATGIRD